MPRFSPIFSNEVAMKHVPRSLKAIYPSALSVLEAIMVIHRQRGRVTLDLIQKHLGWTGGRTYTQECVIRLRKEGLVSFNDRQCGTIVPRVRFITVEDL